MKKYYKMPLMMVNLKNLKIGTIQRIDSMVAETLDMKAKRKENKKSKMENIPPFINNKEIINIFTNKKIIVKQFGQRKLLTDLQEEPKKTTKMRKKIVG